MRKKFLLLIILLVSVLAFVFIFKFFVNDKELSDALRFKEEYESLNDEDHVSVLIDEDNPFVYSNASDIIERVNNKESFVVYFGFNKCPYCRSALPSLIEASNYLDIDKIYYVDVSDIRDVMSIDDNGDVVTDKKGTDGYYELLKIFDNVLANYSLVDDDGEEVMTGSKRIYAPNVVTVVNGEVISLNTGIEDDVVIKSNKGLSDEDKKNTYDNFYSLLDDYVTKVSMCDMDHSGGC